MKQQASTSSNLSSEKFKPSGSGKFDFFVKKYASNSLVNEDSQFDANSEKEQGNEYFKQIQ